MEITPYHPGLYTSIDDIEKKQDEHDWHTAPDAEGKVKTITTVGEMPPVDNLLEEPDPGVKYRMTAMQPDVSNITLNQVVACINWGNTFIHKWKKIDDRKMRAVGRLLQDNILKVVGNIDNNLTTFNTNLTESIKKKADLSVLNQERLIDQQNTLLGKIGGMELNLADTEKNVNEALKGLIAKISEILEFLKEKKEAAIKAKSAIVASKPTQSPMPLPEKPQATLWNLDVAIQEEEPDIFVFGKKPPSGSLDVNPILALRSAHTPQPEVSTVVIAAFDPSYSAFQRSEFVDLTKDDTEPTRKPRHHLYRIDYELFKQQTSYEASQLPYQDFG